MSQPALFEPLPKTPAELHQENLIRQDKRARRAQMIAALGSDIIELNSEILGRSSYFYSRSKKTIYEFNNDLNMLVTPSADVRDHLITFNNLW